MARSEWTRRVYAGLVRSHQLEPESAATTHRQMLLDISEGLTELLANEWHLEVAHEQPVSLQDCLTSLVTAAFALAAVQHIDLDAALEANVTALELSPLRKPIPDDHAPTVADLS